MTETPVCFCCGKELQRVHISTMDQCDDAVMFEAHGNYGSTVFDPVDRRLSLLINICDACVVAWRDRIVLLKEHQPLPTYERLPWEPEDVL